MQLENKKVLTFDCYGTLIDWEKGIIEAMQPILMANGIKISDDEILIHFGRTEHMIQSESPGLLYSQVLEEVVHKFGEKYGFNPTKSEAESFGVSVKNWKPFPDTVAGLQKLACFFKIIIVSNIDNTSIAATVPQLGIDFYKIFTAQEIGAYKPDKKVFRYVFEKLSHEGIQKNDILHVAESIFHDHIPAKDLNLDSVWINRQFDKNTTGATPIVNKVYVPDFQFNTLMDFAKWVEEKMIG